MTEPKKRGAYPKGAAKREEILQHAVEVFGRLGFHAASMREIAKECGLSQAGLLHHFPNKESLLLALVEEREHSQEVATGSSWAEDFYARMLENMENEALTRLWANLVGEATDRKHPAHDYFLERYRKIRAQFAASLAEASEISPEDRLRASVLIAVWDGLQTQWLLDDSFDMREPFAYAMKLLSQKPIE
ncbi:MAG: TetR/AcrR family transcriptional regulator [Micrococcales bacterium]